MKTVLSSGGVGSGSESISSPHCGAPSTPPASDPLLCKRTQSHCTIPKCLSLGLTLHIIVVQLLSRVQLFATPWTAPRQASLSITNSWSLLKVLSIELVMPSNHLILCHPLLLLTSIFPSISLFRVSSSHQVATVLEFQLQHQFFQ